MTPTQVLKTCRKVWAESVCPVSVKSCGEIIGGTCGVTRANLWTERSKHCLGNAG